MRVPFLSHRMTKRQNQPLQSVELVSPFSRECDDNYKQTINNDKVCPIVTPGE